MVCPYGDTNTGWGVQNVHDMAQVPQVHQGLLRPGRDKVAVRLEGHGERPRDDGPEVGERPRPDPVRLMVALSHSSSSSVAVGLGCRGRGRRDPGLPGRVQPGEEEVPPGAEAAEGPGQPEQLGQDRLAKQDWKGERKGGVSRFDFTKYVVQQLPNQYR